MIVDPWGAVIAQAADGECVIAADLDLAAQDAIRGGLPCSPTAAPRHTAGPSLPCGAHFIDRRG